MQIVKIINAIIFLSFLNVPVAAQDIDNLTIIGVKPKIPAYKYVSPYVESDEEQLSREATVSSMLGFSNVSLSYQLYLPLGYSSKRLTH